LPITLRDRRALQLELINPPGMTGDECSRFYTAGGWRECLQAGRQHSQDVRAGLRNLMERFSVGASLLAMNLRGTHSSRVSGLSLTTIASELAPTGRFVRYIQIHCHGDKPVRPTYRLSSIRQGGQRNVQPEPWLSLTHRSTVRVWSYLSADCCHTRTATIL